MRSQGFTQADQASGYATPAATTEKPTSTTLEPLNRSTPFIGVSRTGDYNLPARPRLVVIASTQLSPWTKFRALRPSLKHFQNCQPGNLNEVRRVAILL